MTGCVAFVCDLNNSGNGCLLYGPTIGALTDEVTKRTWIYGFENVQAERKVTFNSGNAETLSDADSHSLEDFAVKFKTSDPLVNVNAMENLTKNTPYKLSLRGRQV